MECPECGFTLREQAAYCSKCGAEIDSLQQQPVDQESNYSESIGNGNSDSEMLAGPEGAPSQGQSPTQNSPSRVAEGRTLATTTRWGRQLSEELPIIDADVIQRNTDKIDMRAAIRSGSAAYFIGFLATFGIYSVFLVPSLITEPGYLILPRNTPTTGVTDIISLDPMAYLAEILWFFYSAHNAKFYIDIEGADYKYGSFQTQSGFRLNEIEGAGNFITQLAATTPRFLLFKLLFIVIPVALFIAGYRHARKQSNMTGPVVDEFVGGATIVIGYLPIVILGGLVSSKSITGTAYDAGASPALGSVILMAGLLYPILFGGLGGVGARITDEHSISLLPGLKYGLGALSLVMVATLVLVQEDLSTGLVFLVYALSFKSGSLVIVLDLLLGSATKQILQLVIAGSIIATGALVVPHDGQAHGRLLAAGYGATIAVGFATGVSIILAIMLSPLLIKETALWHVTADGYEPASTLGNFVSIVMIWGVIYPALLGAVGGGLFGQSTSDIQNNIQ